MLLEIGLVQPKALIGLSVGATGSYDEAAGRWTRPHSSAFTGQVFISALASIHVKFFPTQHFLGSLPY